MGEGGTEGAALAELTRLRVQVGRATLLANVVGAVLTFLYFQVVDPGTSPLDARSGVTVGETVFFVASLAVLCLVASFLIRRYAPEPGRLLAAAGSSTGATPPVGAVAEARRRALNLAPYIALVSLAMWLVEALLAQGVAILLGEGASLRSFVGVFGVGGVVTAAVTFFAVDAIQRRAIPLIFGGDPPSAAGGIRIGVLARLLMVFLLVGVWPSVLVAFAALAHAGELTRAPDPQAALVRLVVVVMFLLGVTTVASAWLAVLVTRGITAPLSRLEAAMARVAAHDYAARVPVTSNDELGYVAERFNAMAAELARAERLRRLFGLYVSPEVAQAALERGAELGGEAIVCSVLFADVRNFTGLTETLPPAALLTLLNRYMSAMIDAIVREGGLVNKFGGDSLLALFGTPLNPAPDHATRAVRAALGMRAALAAFNAATARTGGPTLRIGIGIATGPAVAGNVGGRERLEYTVIGDTVNLASRLQDLCKELGCDVLLSAETFAEAAPHLQLGARHLTGLAIRGKRLPVDAYALPETTAPAAAP